MNIFTTIITNLPDILFIIFILSALALGIYQWIKKIKPSMKDMTEEERVAYITRLLTNLVPIALSLVTRAEIEWGGKTGPIKRSQVIAQLYSYIPDEYKKYITEDNLDAIIEKALVQAENIWESNVKVKSRIEKGV